MIQSMTGYGKASGKIRDGMVQVEIRSLNSKSLELGLRLPQAFKEKEAALRKMVSEKIVRGKTDFTLMADNGAGGSGQLNSLAIKNYVRQLQRLAGELHLVQEQFLPLALTLPDAIREEKSGVSERLWRQVQPVVERAMRDFIRFRHKEGKALEKDLVSRLKAIQQMFGELESLEPVRTKAVQARLAKMMEQSDDGSVDKNRFEQELLFYLERMDMNEEKIRLKSHCSYFLETIRSAQPNGKKLGFIAQEMGREINTIGAKANDAGIQRVVVRMKDELEKVKEQLANVL